MRSLAYVGLLLVANCVAPALGSDFEETKQEISDFAFSASMQGKPDGIAREPQTLARQRAFLAHCACIAQAIREGFGSAVLPIRCATSRAAYAEFLPKLLANEQLIALERKLAD